MRLRLAIDRGNHRVRKNREMRGKEPGKSGKWGDGVFENREAEGQAFGLRKFGMDSARARGNRRRQEIVGEDDGLWEKLTDGGG